MHTPPEARFHIYIPHATLSSTHYLHTRETTVHLQAQAQAPDVTVASRLTPAVPAATTIATTIELSKCPRTQTIRGIAVVALENNALSERNDSLPSWIKS